MEMVGLNADMQHVMYMNFQEDRDRESESQEHLQ